MSEINKKIDDKLKEYPENIQKLARYAIKQANLLNSQQLSQLLEAELKKIVRERQ